MFIGLVIVIAVFTSCMMLRSRPPAVAIATITPHVWRSSPHDEGGSSEHDINR